MPMLIFWCFPFAALLNYLGHAASGNESCYHGKAVCDSIATELATLSENEEHVLDGKVQLLQKHARSEVKTDLQRNGAQPREGDAHSPPSRFEQLKNEVEKSAKDFVSSAQQADYVATEGRFRFWLLPDCAKNIAHGLTCFANNPTSPYGIFYVPPKPGDSLNSSQCYTKFLPFCDTINDATVAMPWHMEHDEAIVLVGVSPPDMRYFGFTPYLFEHTYGPDWTPNMSLIESSRCPDNRCDVFASMGDAINVGNFNVSNKSAGPFSQPFALVLTTSPTVYNQLRPLLEENFPGAVNLLRFPGAILNMGQGSGKDTLAGLLRMAFPADRDDYNDFVNTMPFFLYRLTPRKASANLELYSRPSYCEDGQKYPIDYCMTVRNPDPEAYRAEEADLTNKMLETAQTIAIHKIKRYIGYRWESIVTAFIAGVPDLGFSCLDYGQYCQGDTRDTFYPASKKFYMLDAVTNINLPQFKSTLLANESIFIVGVNHKEAGASRYASITLYDFNDLKGIKSATDMDMKGTADVWLSGTESAHLSKYIYVIEYARDCGERPACVVVPSPGDSEELFIPFEHSLLFIERSYYDETTGVSPAGQGLVMPKLLKSNDFVQP